jgi:hypothetical protein
MRRGTGSCSSAETVRPCEVSTINSVLPPTKCLVLGSCTGQKDDSACPSDLKLREESFAEPLHLLKAEAEAKPWLKPAGEMYTGRQHALMMNGVRYLRQGFRRASFDVSIVSAGYGLISEDRLIAPYNITFQGMGHSRVRARGDLLQIPTMTRDLVTRYQVVFFLLGRENLTSCGIPPLPEPGQRFVYFGKAIEDFHLPPAGVTVLPAAQKEARRYGGAGVTGIKGRMFELFAKGVTEHPDLWETFMTDHTANTLREIMSRTLGEDHV